MSTNNNPMMVLASMLGTFVAGSGVYMQWVDRDTKNQEKVVEVKQQSSVQAEMQSDKYAIQVPVIHQPNIQAVAMPEMQAMTTIAAAETSEVEPHKTEATKKPKHKLDDLDLPPPPKGFEDIDLDKSGF